MTKNVKKLLDDALNLLDESERAQLAASLIESLESSIDPAIETVWEREISQRLAELDSGSVTPLPWTEARRKILEGIR